MNDTINRHDIYALIHKGLRGCMSDVLARTGRVDVDDDEDVHQTASAVRGLLSICRSHLEHEDKHLHRAMEERRAGSAKTTLADHAKHLEAFEEIDSLLRALESSEGAARAAAAQRLYRALAVFVADNYEHMNVEETENNEVLWATYTDDELRAIERAIVASQTPEQMRLTLRWMVPSMAPAERAALLGGLQQGAPAEVFGDVLSLVKQHLSARDWFKLMLVLGPVPASV
jgi:hypothetical protein